MPQHQPERVPAGALAEFLLRGRNADGGWGYYPEKSSRLEPTAWATLALRETAGAGDTPSALEQWPSKDGLLLAPSTYETTFDVVDHFKIIRLGAERPGVTDDSQLVGARLFGY